MDNLPQNRNNTPFFIQKVKSGERISKDGYAPLNFQLYYICKGYVTQKTARETRSLRFGDLRLVPPNLTEEIQTETDNGEFFYCCCSAETAEEILRSQTATEKTIINAFRLGKSVVLKNIPLQTQRYLAEILDFMAVVYQTNAFFAEQPLKNALGIVLYLCAEAMQKQKNATAGAFERYKVLSCVDYVKNNYLKSLTLNSVVKLACMQAREFCKQFKQATGYTFNEYINKLRMEKALQLLKDERLPFTKIATLCGYGNYITFYRNFIKYTGLTPLEYIGVKGIGQAK